MTGPHQSIMSRLTCAGQGAAPCQTRTSDRPLKALFTGADKRSSRMNCVGTKCRLVMPCASISAKVCAASKRCVMTTALPANSGKNEKLHCAEW